jgi:hypothetical protein
MFAARFVSASAYWLSVGALAVAVSGLAPSAAWADCKGGAKPVATVENVFASVEVKSEGDSQFRRVSRGLKLCVGDKLRTGAKGRVRIEFDDRVEAGNRGPSVVNIGNDTEIAIESFLVEPSVGGRNAVVELINGVMRTFFKNFSGERSEHWVRTGASLCGIRGSEVVSIHLPARQSIEHLVDHGLMVCKAPTGDIAIKDEQQIEIVGGRFGPVHPLDRARYAELTKSIDLQGGRGCQGIAGTWAWFINGDITFAASADASVQSSSGSHKQGPLSGTWSCQDGRVRMEWNHGWVDILSLSDDGESLSGRGWQKKDPLLGKSGGHAVSGRKK